MVRATRQIEYEVATCQICQRSHRFTLALTVSRIEKPPVFFGGETNQDVPWDVYLVCPVKKRPFIEHAQLQIEPGEELESVEQVHATKPPPSSSQQLKEPHDWLTEDLTEWIKTSPNKARDFCSTMITVCTGAIPVFFAVLKFLGREQISSRPWALSVVSPFLFLAAATVFALGLRPVLIDLVNTDDFARTREKRLRTLNRFMVVATLLFLLGVAAAIIIWLIAMLS